MPAAVAVDFGASSIRVCRVELGDGEVRLEVVHRHAHAPVPDGEGHLRWDWTRLVAEMECGLELALAKGPVASIGIDTWGVDYGLLDRNGRLVEPPISYRDGRTRGYRSFVERIGEQRLYEIAGLQLLAFNTIFQLATHDPVSLARAERIVMLPELLVHHLTGEVRAETTSAGTTGLLDVATGLWSDELCDAIGLARNLLPEIEPAGTLVGRWRGTPVYLVGGHDTASAVAAGSVKGDAFVSSGTWLLIGREQEAPDTSESARRSGFSNEQGVLGGVRFLRNAAGWWLLERCREAWEDDIDELVASAGADRCRERPIVDTTDERFLAPLDMESELRDAAGLGPRASRGALVRCIVDSMAATTATVVAGLDDVRGITVFGGGTQSRAYLDELKLRSGLPVRAGPVEATALGNALVQGVALGVYHSLAQARASILGC